MGSCGGWCSLSSATFFIVSAPKIYRGPDMAAAWSLLDKLGFYTAVVCLSLLGDVLLVIKATKQQQREICSGWHSTSHQICLEKWQAPLRLLKTQCTVRKITAISYTTWAAAWINGSNLCVVLPSKLLLNVVQEYCVILVYAAHFPHRPNCRCIK